MKPTPNYYERIRKIAISGRQPVTTLILARYKNKNDIGIIKKLLQKGNYYGICAAREFTAPEFYSLLIKKFEREFAKKDDFRESYNDGGVLIEALARYPSHETRKLFERAVVASKGNTYPELHKLIFTAIHKYPHPVFEPLKKLIKLADYEQDYLMEEIEAVTW